MHKRMQRQLPLQDSRHGLRLNLWLPSSARKWKRLLKQDEQSGGFQEKDRGDWNGTFTLLLDLCLQAHSRFRQVEQIYASR